MNFRHITVSEVEPEVPRKTKLWDVCNKYDGGFLGRIAWFGRWRKYAFYPANYAVFEEVCMRELSQFIVNQTLLHRESAKRKDSSHA